MKYFFGVSVVLMISAVARAEGSAVYDCYQATGHDGLSEKKLVYGYKTAELWVNGTELTLKIAAPGGELRATSLIPDTRTWYPRHPFHAVYLTNTGATVQLSKSLLDGAQGGWLGFRIPGPAVAFYCERSSYLN